MRLTVEDRLARLERENLIFKRVVSVCVLATAVSVAAHAFPATPPAEAQAQPATQMMKTLIADAVYAKTIMVVDPHRAGGSSILLQTNDSNEVSISLNGGPETVSPGPSLLLGVKQTGATIDFWGANVTAQLGLGTSPPYPGVIRVYGASVPGQDLTPVLWSAP